MLDKIAGSAIVILNVSKAASIYTQTHPLLSEDQGQFHARFSINRPQVKLGLTIYRPQCPPGFCILGDIVGYYHDRTVTKAAIKLCIQIKKNFPIIAEAQGFAKVWSNEGLESRNVHRSGESDGIDEGFGSSEGSASGLASGHSGTLAFWKPIVPSDDYVALGHLATTSYEPPSYEHVCVVHKNVTTKEVCAPVWSDESGMISLFTPYNNWDNSYRNLNLGLFLTSRPLATPKRSVWPEFQRCHKFKLLLLSSYNGKLPIHP